MKYMLMCCFDEDRWQSMPETERDRLMQEYGAWIRKLDEKGCHLSSAQLQPSASAGTVRMRDGKPFVTDGPFAETKEQFGGYHLVECSDYDEAVALASRIPTLKLGGTVEVREVATTS